MRSRIFCAGSPGRSITTRGPTSTAPPRAAWASCCCARASCGPTCWARTGRDVTLYRLFAGDVCILSASCVLDAVTFDVHIDAEEPVEAYCIGAGAFKRVMDENIYVRCYAYQMTAESYSETMWAMQQILFMSADRRLAIFLTDELAKTGGADLRMTHDQIARYMGSAREVVSRMLKYFAQEGLVQLWRGGLTVLDKPRLQKLARGETAAAAGNGAESRETKKPKNPNPSPTGKRFGFFLFGGPART